MTEPARYLRCDQTGVVVSEWRQHCKAFARGLGIRTGRQKRKAMKALRRHERAVERATR